MLKPEKQVEKKFYEINIKHHVRISVKIFTTCQILNLKKFTTCQTLKEKLISE